MSKEKMRPAPEPEPEPEQCDWFGYHGDKSQCKAEATTSVNSRPLCADHAEMVVPE